ncbi:MAG: DUF2244 domain-containing protein [Halieaceae bacterium]|nr:DUF2244 domain-containing protein [Halieaceae bacterium]
MVYEQRTGDDDMIVAEPNRSASWQTNKIVLLLMCFWSGAIAVGFAAMGAWPILPFAGLEMAALGGALYYVCWKLRYRHVITLSGSTVRIQKGHYFPKREWEISTDDVALSVIPEKHPWDGPAISVFSKGEEISLGEFLNRDDSLKLLDLLRGRVRVGNHSSRGHRPF